MFPRMRITAPSGTLEFSLKEDLSTAILSSDPKRLLPETRFERLPIADPSHYSQSLGTRAFDPAIA